MVTFHVSTFIVQPDRAKGVCDIKTSSASKWAQDCIHWLYYTCSALTRFDAVDMNMNDLSYEYTWGVCWRRGMVWSAGDEIIVWFVCFTFACTLSSLTVLSISIIITSVNLCTYYWQHDKGRRKAFVQVILCNIIMQHDPRCQNHSYYCQSPIE